MFEMPKTEVFHFFDDCALEFPNFLHGFLYRFLINIPVRASLLNEKKQNREVIFKQMTCTCDVCSLR